MIRHLCPLLIGVVFFVDLPGHRNTSRGKEEPNKDPEVQRRKTEDKVLTEPEVIDTRQHADVGQNQADTKAQ
jgi:hypothetical protein